MWDRLEHAYGPATDVPGLLVEARDPDRAAAAVRELDHVVHCGGTRVYSAAPAALPALLDLAEDPAVTVRPAVVEVVGDLGHAGRTAAAVDPAWPGAWERAVPRLTALLADPDVEVRRGVTYPLAQARGVWRALADRFDGEPDRVARLGLVVAAGLHDDPGARDWFTGLLRDGDRAVRVAAVVGLRRLGDEVDTAPLLDPVPEVWEETWWAAPNPVWWLHREVPDRRLVTAWLAHPHAEVRRGALWASGDLLGGRPDPDLLPLVADRLADDEPDNRRVAALLLASVRAPSATPPTADLDSFADDLALAARDVYLPAADAALAALALLGDERAVEPLARRLTGPRLGLAVHRRRATWRLAPPLDEVLTAMAAHAAELAPAVRARLGATADQVEVEALQRVLRSWQR
ncbi:HEAT repeat domain-containing protein [Saccharothrix sp. Mg75]|uniref:HEAT repeat domain-containing protein n=1 Tax=Saccharothrix sp. Mg75 TaxID=3445357 RepID=UPI003EEFD926